MPGVGSRIISPSNPLNRNHSLNRGLVACYMALPGQVRSALRLNNLVSAAYPGVYNGGAENAGAGNRPGGFGSVFTDGSDDFINVGRPLSASAGTIALWMRPLSVTGSQRPISDDGGYCYFSFASDGNLRFEVFTNVSIVTNTAAITAGSWWHIAGTWLSGDVIAFYVNGVFVHSMTMSLNMGSVANDVKIGGVVNATFRLDAFFDDVRIYNRALTADNLKQLYLLSRTGYPGLLNRVSRAGVGTAAAAVVVGKGLTESLRMGRVSLVR